MNLKITVLLEFNNYQWSCYKMRVSRISCGSECAAPLDKQQRVPWLDYVMEVFSVSWDTSQLSSWAETFCLPEAVTQRSCHPWCSLLWVSTSLYLQQNGRGISGLMASFSFSVAIWGSTSHLLMWCLCVFEKVIVKLSLSLLFQVR